jgi:hypothetical protein
MSNNNSIQEVRIGNWHHMNTGQQLLAAWYWTALTVSIIFILIIPVNWYLPDFLPGITGVENFLGAWWSGVLLFVLASHSYDAGAAAHDRAPKISGAWMIISAILLFFSADEIGSLHERLSLLGDSLEVGGWTFLLPLGGIIGVFLTYALYRRFPRGRRLDISASSGRHNRRFSNVRVIHILAERRRAKKLRTSASDWVRLARFCRDARVCRTCRGLGLRFFGLDSSNDRRGNRASWHDHAFSLRCLITRDR